MYKLVETYNNIIVSHTWFRKFACNN